jgi:hypothetical protein
VHVVSLNCCYGLELGTPEGCTGGCSNIFDEKDTDDDREARRPTTAQHSHVRSGLGLPRLMSPESLTILPASSGTPRQLMGYLCQYFCALRCELFLAWQVCSFLSPCSLCPSLRHATMNSPAICKTIDHTTSYDQLRSRPRQYNVFAEAHIGDLGVGTLSAERYGVHYPMDLF